MDSAADLFAFQGNHTRLKEKPLVPRVVETWPVLPSDPEAASIAMPTAPGASNAEKFNDDSDDPNLNSLLAVSDDQGYLHLYLDGSYPLGVIELDNSASESEIAAVAFEGGQILSETETQLHVTLTRKFADNFVTSLKPECIALPLLDTRKARDLALLSSAMHQLVWYSIRVVRDMRDVWYGTDTLTGAREYGPRWLAALETKLRTQYGSAYHLYLKVSLLKKMVRKEPSWFAGVDPLSCNRQNE